MSKANPDGILKAVKRVRGGVAVSHNKHTAGCEAVRMPAPKQVVIAMRQHVGAPCQPTVKTGDTVAVGQVIGKSDAYVSAPIHASVSGTVTGIGEITLANGITTQAVTIESDGEMRLLESIAPPKVDTLEQFLQAVRDGGLVGLGGAGFPTHVKLNIPKGKKAHTLIVNAAECEPYITVDHRECLDNSWDILSGVNILKNMLQLERVIIAVEDNKPDAIAALQRVAEQDDSTDNTVRLMTLPSRYPQGAEKVLVNAVTGKEIPPGKLPIDVGCIVMNVASVGFLARFIKTGKPLVSRSITVDGSAVKNPGNVRVPIGTSLADVLDFCGGLTEEPFKLLTGGPMMGLAITGTDVPVLKQNNAILAFAKGNLDMKMERDCIRCGRCAAACPLRLMPTLLMRYAKSGETEKLAKIGATVCMECGSCAYTCPAGIPLVQYMRLAKSLVLQEEKK